MADPTTTRLGISEPQGTDPPSGATQMTSIAATVDALAMIFLQGVAASRPVAGTTGRIYYATDTFEWSYDNGSAWSLLSNILQGTFASRPAAGTKNLLYYGTDTTLLYLDTGSAWVTITAPAVSVPIGATLATWAMCQ